jgi:hypothetical protein
VGVGVGWGCGGGCGCGFGGVVFGPDVRFVRGVCKREVSGRLWAKAFASQVPTYQWPRLIIVFSKEQRLGGFGVWEWERCCGF